MRLPTKAPLASYLLTSTIGIVSASDAKIGCTAVVNTSEIFPAGNALGDYCLTRGPIGRETKVSWTLGSTRVYVCNYSKTGNNPCSLAEIETAWNDIQQACGSGIGGWWYRGDWKKTYGFDNINADWCGNM